MSVDFDGRVAIVTGAGDGPRGLDRARGRQRARTQRDRKGERRGTALTQDGIGTRTAEHGRARRVARRACGDVRGDIRAADGRYR